MSDIFSQYYKLFRPELIGFIPTGNHKVLDVGCAEGFLGEALKKQARASEVIGIEIFTDAAAKAKSRLDKVISGDLESMDFTREGLEERTFDYIICGDVLEHLRNPWKELERLVALLKASGRVIVSIPNVRHWRVVFPLLFRGTWRYGAHGILDRTHLRFFTRKSAFQLLESVGLCVESCKGSPVRRKVDRIYRIAMLGMGKELLTVQWTLVGRLGEGK